MAETVTDKNKEYFYYTHISNIVDELDLSPLAIALYFHYKRWQHAEFKKPIAVTDLMKKYKCGSPSIKRAKDELIQNELITIDESQRHLGIADQVEVINIIERNFEHFQAKKRLTNQQEATYQSARRPLTNQQGDPLPDSNALKKDKSRKIKVEEKKEEDHAPDLNLAVKIYQEVFPTTTVGSLRLSELENRLPTVNPILWRQTLKDWILDGYKSGSISKMIDRYEEQLKRQTKNNGGAKKNQWSKDDYAKHFRQQMAESNGKRV